VRIKEVCIENYKSFDGTGPVKLGAGFNVVVGQNNSGKTAFLEALCPRLIGNNPHRRIECGVPNVPKSLSTFTYKISLPGQDLRRILLQRGGSYHVNPKVMQVNHREMVDEYFAIDSMEFDLRYQNGGWQEIGKHEHNFPIQVDATNGGIISGQASNPIPVGRAVGDAFSANSFLFKAERLSLSSHPIEDGIELLPNAANLATAILHLQTRNPGRFARLNNLIRRIFPSLHGISVKLQGGRSHVRVWSIDPTQEHEELSFDLANSGTGIGQAVAILFLIVSSDNPRIIAIDEPNSFLHPAAARELLSILAQEKHQYIISTHAAEMIFLSKPSTLQLMQWSGEHTTITELSANEIKDVRRALGDIGVRLSELFGAEHIVWVEGQTEEECFPLIAEHFKIAAPKATAFVAIKNTGDFEKAKMATLALDLYTRLSTANALLPPAIAFSFDREGRSQGEVDDLMRRGDQNVRFLTRKMYENYLIRPDAISTVLSDVLNSPIEALTVRKWVEQRGGDHKYEAPDCWNGNLTNAKWLAKVHGGKLLDDVFAELSEARASYRKREYGVALTEWLLAHAPDDLVEVRRYIESILTSAQEPAK
jgi:hypothetical protein